MAPGAVTPLTGRDILIVEDRYLIASEIAEVLARCGAQVLGPAANLAAAEAILGPKTPDFAVLDVNLEGEMVFPLAERLDRGGASILFLTGYSEDVLPLPWRGRPRLLKPVDPRQLCETLFQLADAKSAQPQA